MTASAASDRPMPDGIVVKPVTRARWGDMEELFERPGPGAARPTRAAAGACCGASRARTSRPGGASDKSPDRGAGNKAVMVEIVRRDRRPGLLAYVDGTAVGWCAVEPASRPPAHPQLAVGGRPARGRRRRHLVGVVLLRPRIGQAEGRRRGAARGRRRDGHQGRRRRSSRATPCRRATATRSPGTPRCSRRPASPSSWAIDRSTAGRSTVDALERQRRRRPTDRAVRGSRPRLGTAPVSRGSGRRLGAATSRRPRPWRRCRCTSPGSGRKARRPSSAHGVEEPLAQQRVGGHAAAEAQALGPDLAAAARRALATSTSTTASWNDAATSAVADVGVLADVVDHRRS